MGEDCAVGAHEPEWVLERVDGSDLPVFGDRHGAATGARCFDGRPLPAAVPPASETERLLRYSGSMDQPMRCALSGDQWTDAISRTDPTGAPRIDGLRTAWRSAEAVVPNGPSMTLR